MSLKAVLTYCRYDNFLNEIGTFKKTMKEKIIVTLGAVLGGAVLYSIIAFILWDINFIPNMFDSVHGRIAFVGYTILTVPSCMAGAFLGYNIEEYF